MRSVSINLIQIHNELTMQESATLLNVSRPYFITLLENGVIPHHTVGKHRLVFAKDVLGYKDKISKARGKSLEKLTGQAQQLHMGYDDECMNI